MGTAASSILAEAYIQNMEHRQIQSILIEHQIIEYFRYLDGILIFYDERETNV
jgi:hypothetical protein